MKHTVQTLLILLVLSLAAANCSKTSTSDDANPPEAGFTLSSQELTQWDSATITDNSTSSLAEKTVTYTVSGGEYEMEDNSIQFLEAGTYTVTQTITNEDGSDASSLTVEVSAPNNVYTLDEEEFTIGTEDQPNFFWFDGTAQGGTIYLRALGDVEGQDNPNLIKLMPVPGPNPVQGVYPWSDSGDIGTYDVGMTANYAGFNYDWTTDGDSGEDLTIELIYKADDAEDNVYDITLPSYTLNYGDFDWTTGELVVDGTKELSISYRGKIDPAN